MPLPTAAQAKVTRPNHPTTHPSLACSSLAQHQRQSCSAPLSTAPPPPPPHRVGGARGGGGGGGAAAAKKSDARAFIPSSNPYFPTGDNSDAPASRPRPNAESFLARVAAAAERTGGVNDALQLSMMRKRGEGRNVYVFRDGVKWGFVTFGAGM